MAQKIITQALTPILVSTLNRGEYFIFIAGKTYTFFTADSKRSITFQKPVKGRIIHTQAAGYVTVGTLNARPEMQGTLSLVEEVLPFVLKAQLSTLHQSTRFFLHSEVTYRGVSLFDGFKSYYSCDRILGRVVDFPGTHLLPFEVKESDAYVPVLLSIKGKEEFVFLKKTSLVSIF